MTYRTQRKLEIKNCFIFFVARWQNVDCRVGSKCCIAFSVSIMRLLRKLYAARSIAKLRSRLMLFICSVVKSILERLIIQLWCMCAGLGGWLVVCYVWCVWKYIQLLIESVVVHCTLPCLGVWKLTTVQYNTRT
jgi:hypothetical protein